MKLAKTVTGVYALDGGDVVDSDEFSEDDLPRQLQERHDLEKEYSDAERTVLPTERVAELSGRSVEDIRDLQKEAARQRTREAVKEAGGRDRLLVQAVRALEDMDEVNNELSERLRPWYALHFPELEDDISDHEEFAALVSEHARRDDIDRYEAMAEDSTGMPITADDAAMLERFAAHLDNSHGLREEVEAYVQGLAEAVAPNLSAVLGPVLAARVVSLAGSLDQLAKMPSSTVQVLGAEKAMFRHMRGEGEAPKHGVLFMHEYVRKVPEEEQGRMARVLANKASIAARIDNYGGEFRGEELAGEVEETFEEIHDG